MKKITYSIIFLIVTIISAAQPAWKLSIQTWTFHKFSFLESVHKADSLGIKFIEAYPGQPVGGTLPGVFNYNLDKDARMKLKHYLDYLKIKVIAFGVVDKDYYKKRSNIEKYFIFCRDMNIPYMTAEPEWEDLDEFNRLAEKYKVKVALHCHPRPGSHYWHPDSMLLAMKGRKNIGAWPDLGHWTKSGIHPVEGLKKLEGKIWGLHFKDVKEFNSVTAEDTLFGKGAADLAGVLKELKRQKFNGVISMEYEANEDNNMEDMRRNKLFYEMEVKKILAKPNN